MILVVGPEPPAAGAAYRVLAVSPPRHGGLLDTLPVQQLLAESLRSPQTTVLPFVPGERHMGGIAACPCLVMPFQCGEKRVGTLVALGLMDERFTGSVLEIQDVLSEAIAVILENALLAEKKEQALRSLEQEIEERKRLQREREELIGKLRQALAEARSPDGLPPVCSRCQKVRDEQGCWRPIEAYLEAQAGSATRHGLCPECLGEENSGGEATGP